MPKFTRPIAYVDGLEKEGLSADAKAVRVILRVLYGQKQARIELPVGEPLADQEPGTETYRRELQELVFALTEVAASPQGVSWPPRP